MTFWFKKQITGKNINLTKPTQIQNWYLDFLIDPSFQGVDRFFVSSFKNEKDEDSYKRYHFLAIEITD